MTLDKTVVSRINRKYKKDFEDFKGYDRIVAMEWDGIPNLKDEDYYVEFRDTTGRDIVQQAVNIYATQRPKWDVIPRGMGDVDTAEDFERIIEWYMWKASQMGAKRFHSEALINACKYNKVCAQLEWTDDYSFCVKVHHPGTVLYEYGSKLQWVSVVNNVTAVSIVEHWSDYAKPNWYEKITKGDEIGKALKKIQEMADDDPEQHMMYVDYTDDKRRYVYCYPVSDERIDDSFGYDHDGAEKKDLIVIQDKTNELGFINWAISEGEGDPLLAPLLKAHLYDNINDSETLKRTIAFRRAFFPLFIQDGREDADAEVDMSGAQVVIKSPTGANLRQTTPPPLDPAFNELSAQDKNVMTNSVGLGQTASLQAANVQHSTLQDVIKLRLSQLEPYKRVTEQAFVQLAYLMFKWAKKKERLLKGTVLYDMENYARGGEVGVRPEQINLDALYIECRILPNNENDKLQITNQVSMMKQSGLAIPDDEYVEMLYMGAAPSVLRARYEKQEIRNAALQAKVKEIVSEVDMAMQMKLAEFNANLQQQMQQAQMQQQMQGQQMAQGQQGPLPQDVAPQQGQPLPSDGAMTGQGFNAAQGGMPPQEAAPEITQGMR